MRKPFVGNYDAVAPPATLPTGAVASRRSRWT